MAVTRRGEDQIYPYSRHVSRHVITSAHLDRDAAGARLRRPLGGARDLVVEVLGVLVGAELLLVDPEAAEERQVDAVGRARREAKAAQVARDVGREPVVPSCNVT